MCRRRLRSESGSAVLVVALLMCLLSAIAAGAAAVVRVEIMIADRHHRSAEAFFAAEAALESAISELRTVVDWTTVVSGATRSRYTDGGFAGFKAIPGAGTIELCCGAQTAAGRLASDTQLSPLPARRAIVWRPFLWIAFDRLAPRDPPSRLFVIAWVANDEEDVAGGAVVDTNDTLLVRAEAVAATGTRRLVEAVIARPPPPVPFSAGADAARRLAIGIVKWREVR